MFHLKSYLQNQSKRPSVVRALGVSALALMLSSTASVAQVTPVPHALENYIEIAMKQNPDIQAERARRSQADARVDQANSNLYPRLDLSLQYNSLAGGREIVLPFGNTPVTLNTAKLGIITWDNKLTASWQIFNMAVWAGSKATKAYLDAATAGVNAKELAVGYQVEDAYYGYAKASELVAVRQNAIQLAKENLATADALFKAEKAPKNDVLRAEVAVAAAQGDLLTAQNTQNLARTNFNNLLKRDYSESIDLPAAEAMASQNSMKDVASTDQAATAQLPMFTQDFDQAMRDRPEMLQLQNSHLAIEGYRKVNTSDYFPNVGVFASYGFQEDKLAFSPNADYFLAGVQLKWNLFSGFNTNGKVAETDGQLAELEYQKESAINGIRIELQNARLELENTKERHKIALKQLQSAEENNRITKAQYDQGMAPLITMIDAQTTLANANANLTVTTYDELLAEAKYRKALGVR